MDPRVGTLSMVRRSWVSWSRRQPLTRHCVQTPWSGSLWRGLLPRVRVPLLGLRALNPSQKLAFQGGSDGGLPGGFLRALMCRVHPEMGGVADDSQLERWKVICAPI